MGENPDILWKLMPLMIYTFSAYRLIVPTAMLLVHLDPWYYIYQHFEWDDNMVAEAVRIYITVVLAFELLRMVPFVFVFGLSLLKTLTLNIQLIKKSIKNVALPERGIFEYSKVLLGYAKCRPFIEFNVFSLLAIALFGTVFFSFMSIRYYNHFPFWFYAVFPSSTVMFIIFNQVDFHIILGITSESEKLIRIWQSSISEICMISVKRRKFLIRKVKVAKPFQFAGRIADYRFFTLDNSIKADYFETCLNNTINFLLSVG